MSTGAEEAERAETESTQRTLRGGVTRRQPRVAAGLRPCPFRVSLLLRGLCVYSDSVISAPSVISQPNRAARDTVSASQRRPGPPVDPVRACTDTLPRGCGDERSGRVQRGSAYFVDRHLPEGRGERVAIENGDERITYREVFEGVNRVGSALRHELGVRPGERVVLLTLDCPEMIYGFFGAMKIGAIPIPTNTLWKTADCAYVLKDSGATVAIVSEGLLPLILAIPREDVVHLRQIVVVGSTAARIRLFARSPSSRRAAQTASTRSLTSKDAPAFWLYSSGSTGAPKGCIHLHHDMVVCADLYARWGARHHRGRSMLQRGQAVLCVRPGNALYFPFSVGRNGDSVARGAHSANVYAVIERHRPTLFFSVPTNYGMLLAHRREGADFDLSSVRHAISAGEALPAALFHRFHERFGIEILDGIGSTEVLHIFISNRPGADAAWLQRPGDPRLRSPAARR